MYTYAQGWVSQSESNEYRVRNSEAFHTCLGLSLAANHLPLFSRQSKAKVAEEASAKVEKKVNKIFS